MTENVTSGGFETSLLIGRVTPKDSCTGVRSGAFCGAGFRPSCIVGQTWSFVRIKLFENNYSYRPKVSLLRHFTKLTCQNVVDSEPPYTPFKATPSSLTSLSRRGLFAKANTSSWCSAQKGGGKKPQHQ